MTAYTFVIPEAAWACLIVLTTPLLVTKEALDRMGEVPRPTLNKVRPLAKNTRLGPTRARKRAIIARGIEQEVEEVCSESANVAAIIAPFGPGGSPARIDAVALLRLDSIGDSQESRSHLQAQYKPVKTIIGVPMISLQKMMQV